MMIERLSNSCKITTTEHLSRKYDTQHSKHWGFSIHLVACESILRESNFVFMEDLGAEIWNISSPWWVLGRDQKSMVVFVLIFLQRNPLTNKYGSLLQYWFHQRRSIQKRSYNGISYAVLHYSRNNKKKNKKWLLGVLDEAVAPQKMAMELNLSLKWFPSDSHCYLDCFMVGRKFAFKVVISCGFNSVETYQVHEMGIIFQTRAKQTFETASNTAIRDGQWMTLFRSGCSNSLGQIFWPSSNLWV